MSKKLVEDYFKGILQKLLLNDVENYKHAQIGSFAPRFEPICAKIEINTADHVVRYLPEPHE
jgi:hypothetical protein